MKLNIFLAFLSRKQSSLKKHFSNLKTWKIFFYWSDKNITDFLLFCVQPFGKFSNFLSDFSHKIYYKVIARPNLTKSFYFSSKEWNIKSKIFSCLDDFRLNNQLSFTEYTQSKIGCSIVEGNHSIQIFLQQKECL